LAHVLTVLSTRSSLRSSSIEIIVLFEEKHLQYFLFFPVSLYSLLLH
jgi:hypothetical protein